MSAPVSPAPSEAFQRIDSLSSSGCCRARSLKVASNTQPRSVLKTSSAPERSGQSASTVAPSSSNTRTLSARTVVIAGSTRTRPPRSGAQATRSPSRRSGSGAANEVPGSPREMGTRRSGPAIADSTSATSATVRPIGPCTDSCDHPIAAGQVGTRPGVGRSPTTLQNAAGLRSDPPKSLPSATGTNPAASAAAAPPLEPPADSPCRYGLCVTPKIGLNVCEPAANSGTFVLPIRTVPAARSRATTSSSSSGTVSASGEPQVVRMPPVAWLSLCATGSPCSGPSSSPAASAASAASAAARAPSASNVTTALTRPSTSSMRARQASVNSRADSCRERISAASSVAGRRHNSSSTRRACHGDQPGADRSWSPEDRSGSARGVGRDDVRDLVGAGLGRAGPVLAVQADGDQRDVVLGPAVDQSFEHLVEQLLERQVGHLGQRLPQPHQAGVQVGVAPLDEPVGEQQHRGPAVEGHHRLLALDLVVDAQQQVALPGGQLGHTAVGVDHQRRQVPGVGPAHPGDAALTLVVGLLEAGHGSRPQHVG